MDVAVFGRELEISRCAMKEKKPKHCGSRTPIIVNKQWERENNNIQEAGSLSLVSLPPRQAGMLFAVGLLSPQELDPASLLPLLFPLLADCTRLSLAIHFNIFHGHLSLKLISFITCPSPSRSATTQNMP